MVEYTACDRVLVNSISAVRVSCDRMAWTRVLPRVDTQLFRNLDLERERFVVRLGSFDAIKGIESAIWLCLYWLSRVHRWSGLPIQERNVPTKNERSGGFLGVDLRVRLGISDDEVVETLNRATLLICVQAEPFGCAS